MTGVDLLTLFAAAEEIDASDQCVLIDEMFYAHACCLRAAKRPAVVRHVRTYAVVSKHTLFDGAPARCVFCSGYVTDSGYSDSFL